MPCFLAKQSHILYELLQRWCNQRTAARTCQDVYIGLGSISGRCESDIKNIAVMSSVSSSSIHNTASL